MKRILSFVAIVAVLLGMASCNKKDDVQVQKFKITVENVSTTSAYISIVPPTEETPYKVTIISKNLFDPNAKDTKAINWWNVRTGTMEEYKQENLVPNTKCVVAAAEVDEEGNIIGGIEYVDFQTETLPYQMAETPNDEPIHFTGEYYYLPDNGFSSVLGKSEIKDEGVTLELYLYTIGNKAIGHFTTDDLINYFIIICHVKATDKNGDSESMLVFGADYNVTYDEATEEYIYEGWVDMMESEKQAIRLPFTMNCTEYVEE